MTERVLPHFCYIVVSDGRDCLGESTYVSSAFLRRIYPEAEITILTDGPTESVLASKPFRFDDHDARIHTVPVDSVHRSLAERSRFIKTQLRKWIEGNLVYLDADALPFRPFDELFTTTKTVACALDRNAEFPRPHMPLWVEPIYRHYHWQYPQPNYFNTGVLYLADNEESHALGDLWHQRWKDQVATFGKHQDQPSFNSALHNLGTKVEVMPVAFNAMVEASPYYARNARIVHYFLCGESRQLDPGSLLAQITAEVMETGTFRWEQFEDAWQHRSPWVRPTDSLHRALATRDYGDALRTVAKRLCHGLSLSS